MPRNFFESVQETLKDANSFNEAAADAAEFLAARPSRA